MLRKCLEGYLLNIVADSVLVLDVDQLVDKDSFTLVFPKGDQEDVRFHSLEVQGFLSDFFLNI